MTFQQVKQVQQVQHSLRNLKGTLRFLQNNRSDINIKDVIRNDAEFRPLEYPGVLDVDLTALTSEERLAFKIVVCVLCCLSLCGNISTLGVNLNRKMRPFFRACLISLAISDLLSTVFSTTVYIAQLSTEYAQIWILGRTMCTFQPFATTTAILASSMTLVVIALDRYFAVMKTFVFKWKPGHISGVFCMLTIWVVAICIACPVFCIYHIMPVYILTKVQLESEANADTVEIVETVVQRNWQADNQLVFMCLSDQKDVALYYIVVFSVIFAPCIIAFVWLNATIAKEIWIRRHRISKKVEYNERRTGRVEGLSPDIESDNFTKSENISMPTIDTKIVAGTTSHIKTSYCIKNTREARHLRMFVVLILLIAVFLCFRLPAWIFLLMRMYGNYSKPHDWMIYFTFGIMNLLSCVLNPLFYTFLHATIQYILCCKIKCKKRSRHMQRCFGECSFGHFRMASNGSDMNFSCSPCSDIFCRGCWTNDSDERNRSLRSVRSVGSVHLERDEGLHHIENFRAEMEGQKNDAADNFKNDNDSFGPECNQQIFTVFSVSLVPVMGDNVIEESKLSKF